MAIEYFGKTDLLLLANLVHTELAKYVKAVSGKDLSTNDFTNELKNKLEGINTVVEASMSDTSENPVQNKVIKAYVDAAISGVAGIRFTKVASISELPTTGQTGTIYLVPNSGSGSNLYDEYFWDASANKYELFGNSSVDLTDYLKKTDVVELTSAEVQAAWDSVFNV